MAENYADRYTVVDEQGKQYGPYDLPILISWTKSKKINAETTLIAEFTNSVVKVKNVDELKPYLVGTPPVVVDESTVSVANDTLQDNTSSIQNVPDILKDTTGTTINIVNNIQSNNTGQVANSVPIMVGPRSKTMAIILAVFLGALGIHRFYLGYTAIGTIMLLLTLLTCGSGAILTSIWALVDIVLILTDNLKSADGTSLTN